MLNPRLEHLEKDYKNHNDQIILCEVYIDQITMIINNNKVNYGSVNDNSGDNLQKNLREKAKTFRERSSNKINRNITPMRKNLSTKRPESISSSKQVLQSSKSRKNLDNSGLLTSRKTFGNRNDKSIDLKRDKSTKSITRKATSPGKKKYEKSPFQPKTPLKQGTPNNAHNLKGNNINNGKNTLNKFHLNKKQENGLNISKTSKATSNNDNSIQLKTYKTEGSKPRLKVNKKANKNTNLANKLSINTGNGEIDVSNIITLEQDVTDDLIMNQKEDKLLLSDLDDNIENSHLKTDVNVQSNKISNDNNLNSLNSNSNNNNNINNKDNILPKNETEYEDIIDDRWSNISCFLSKYDLINLMLVNRKLHKLNINKFLGCCKTEMLVYQEKIKYFKDKYSEEELARELSPFALTKGAIKAVDLLNTQIYTKIFNTTSVPNEDILFAYKLYFRLLNNEEITKLKGIEFWIKCCNFFIKEDEKTGDIITNNVKYFNFSNENIYKLSKLVSNKEKLITPNYYSKTCATTGLVIFILKDALEYLGIISDKRTVPSQMYRLFSIFLSKAKEKISKLTEIEKNYLLN